jgi:antitoxin MazE
LTGLLPVKEVHVYTMYKHGAAEMKAKVQKWGNSLGIRIPKALAQEVALETDSEVNLTAQDGRLVISPAAPHAVSLRHLLSKVTATNTHGEISMGKVKGKEAW